MDTINAPVWSWAVFAVVVIALLGLDLYVHREGANSSPRAAWIWTGVWIGVSVLFGGGVAVFLGGDAAEEFFSAYLLEKSLSVDNLFLFFVIFEALRVPRQHEGRVLRWGILGAIALRAAFIGIGALLIARFHAILYVFGAILIVSGIGLLRKEEATEPKILTWLQAHLPSTRAFHGGNFIGREEGRLRATPLLLALVAIELSDVLFALDSIPAAFAVTQSPFIVYSSNVFAVLGLRSLYVGVSHGLRELVYLKYGLAAVLVIAGAKMLASSWIHVPAVASLAAVVMCVGGAVVASLVSTRRAARRKRARSTVDNAIASTPNERMADAR